MKTNEIRRLNTRKLMEERFGSGRGAMQKLATLLERPLTQINQLIGENPTRNIGNQMARHIEHQCGKEEGWLDIPQMGVLMPNVSVASMGTETRAVPIISYVQAGMMLEVVDPFTLGDGFATILTDVDCSAFTFALEIRGDSMEPDFREGDRVLIDPKVQPRPGDFVVAKNASDSATFKKYRPRSTGPEGQLIFELVPLNPDYPTLRSDVDDLRIVGTMVEHRRYRKR